MFKFLRICLLIIAVYQAVAEDTETEPIPNEKNTENVVVNMESELLAFIDETENDMKELFSQAYEVALTITAQLKSILGTVLEEVTEIKEGATKKEERDCIMDAVKNIVTVIGDSYRSPPKDVKNIKAAIEQTKKQIKSIKESIFENDVKEAKMKLNECLANQGDPIKCESDLVDLLHEIKTKAREEIGKEFGLTKEIVDDSIDTVEKWLKAHELGVVEKAHELLETAKLCIGKSNEEKDEL